MRLTLRTLLAYLDDVLDPTDKEELAKKIDSSDFAKDLMHRTRDSVRRLRLSAPQVVGTGMGLDPNTVAEYLDNALSPNEVGDYERICLDSDLHLAETAACHHVLTMVLGEPAEVEPRARQRMYMIPAEARELRRLRVEPAHNRPGMSTTVPDVSQLATQSIVASATAPQPAASTRPTAYEVPEYLRSRPWWQSGVFWGAVATALVVGVGLYLIGSQMGLFGRPAEVAAVDADKLDVAEPNQSAIVSESPEVLEPAAPEATVAEETIPPAEEIAGPALGETANDGEATSATADVTTEPVAPAPVVVDPAAVAGAVTQPDATAPAAADTAPFATPPAPTFPDASATADADLAPADAAVPGVVEGLPAESAEMPAEPEAGAISDVPPQADVEETPTTDATGIIPPQASATAPPAASTTVETPPGDTPPVETIAALPAAPVTASPSADTTDTAVDASEDGAPEGPPELGTYLSGKTVLLRLDPDKGGWFRVPPRSAVMAGERLLSLPEFRPKITLASGLLLELSGGTQVVMSTADAVQSPGVDAGDASVPLIEVLYGRIVLLNTSNNENRVRVKVGDIIGEARLERNATLGVEAERNHVPGTDPRKTPAPLTVRMFAPDGGVVWKDASGEITAAEPSRWTFADGEATEVVAESQPPQWIDQEPVVYLSEQRYGAPVIESTLTSDRPVDIQLLELFKGRDRREVKSLVTRASIHVGLFAPFIEALRDSEQKWQTWKTHIATLRAAMAQSPETAEAVYQTLMDQRGRQAAADLYEMLCGYNAEQIGTTPELQKTGALARLIDWLEEDSLDYRVLAVHDLWEITGKQLMPNPSATPSTRKINVRNWRSRLEAGELMPVERGE